MGERLLEEKGRAGDILRSIPKKIIGGLTDNKNIENKSCRYTHTTLLPNTGDDTNLPVLIGLFSLFLICGGRSLILLCKGKRHSK